MVTPNALPLLYRFQLALSNGRQLSYDGIDLYTMFTIDRVEHKPYQFAGANDNLGVDDLQQDLERVTIGMSS